jgi:hypothetical protein
MACPFGAARAGDVRLIPMKWTLASQIPKRQFKIPVSE